MSWTLEQRLTLSVLTDRLSLELTIWGSCIFSSKSHQVLTRWVPAFRCRSPVELMLHSPSDGHLVPHLRAGLVTLGGVECSSLFVSWASSQPSSASANLGEVCCEFGSLACDSARSNARSKLMFALVPLFVPQCLLHNSREGSWEKDKHQQGRQLSNQEH